MFLKMKLAEEQLKTSVLEERMLKAWKILKGTN